jgi:hypothetical protein
MSITIYIIILLNHPNPKPNCNPNLKPNPNPNPNTNPNINPNTNPNTNPNSPLYSKIIPAGLIEDLKGDLKVQKKELSLNNTDSKSTYLGEC